MTEEEEDDYVDLPEEDRDALRNLDSRYTFWIEPVPGTFNTAIVRWWRNPRMRPLSEAGANKRASDIVAEATVRFSAQEGAAYAPLWSKEPPEDAPPVAVFEIQAMRAATRLWRKMTKG